MVGQFKLPGESALNKARELWDRFDPNKYFRGLGWLASLSLLGTGIGLLYINSHSPEAPSAKATCIGFKFGYEGDVLSKHIGQAVIAVDPLINSAKPEDAKATLLGGEAQYHTGEAYIVNGAFQLSWNLSDNSIQTARVTGLTKINNQILSCRVTELNFNPVNHHLTPEIPNFNQPSP